MAIDADTKMLAAPRILCLHGGGTNSRIFRVQCRSIEAQLKTKFRFCYVEAPFSCRVAGPDVLTVYGEYAPFKRWLRWLPEHPEIGAEATVKGIDDAIQAAMDEDDKFGATGEWVGIIGFSQGAKVGASLLLRQQLRAEKFGANNAGSSYRFALLMAGSAPIVSLDLDPTLRVPAALGRASELRTIDPATIEMMLEDESGEDLLRIPTIHLHGLLDPGLELHRLLLRYCAPDSVTLIEWDGHHRVPFKTGDVSVVAEQILVVAKRVGVNFV